MEVSIIIPTYNRDSILEYTLSSLVDQDIGRDRYEVIVVDDGSTDRTKEVAASFDVKLNISYYFQEHIGNRVTLARNAGIARAKGEYLIFLDTDIIVGNSFITEHLRAHEIRMAERQQDSQVRYAVLGYVYGYDVYGDFTSFGSIVDFNAPDESMRRLKESNLFPDYRDTFYRRVNDRLESLHAPWSLFWTSSVSVMRDAVLKTGGFDEEIVTWGMDDIEFGYRLHKQGVQFILSREACAIHYPHERDHEENMRENMENQIQFYRKHPSVLTELYTISDFVYIQEDYAQYLSMQKENEAFYSGLLQEDSVLKLKSLIPAHRNVVVGCQEGFLLSACQSAAGLESNPRLAAAAQKYNPGVPVYEQVGVRTAFKDKSFETCLIVGLISKIPYKYIRALLAEANRISVICYWLCDAVPPKTKGFEFTLESELDPPCMLYRVAKKQPVVEG